MAYGLMRSVFLVEEIIIKVGENNDCDKLTTSHFYIPVIMSLTEMRPK